MSVIIYISYLMVSLLLLALLVGKVEPRIYGIICLTVALSAIWLVV